MEIEGEDGSKLFLKAGAKAVFGRGFGFGTDDLTVSRRHVAFELKPLPPDGTEQSSARVSFEVLGRNPIWVRTQTNGKIRIFRRSETGEVAAGDRFCVSGQRPVWFTLKRRYEVAEESESVSEWDIGLDSVDVSAIDPVEEFGFLVIGREFDMYPPNRLRGIKQWFLEEPRKGNGDSGDDEEDVTERRASGRKRRRKKGNEDEDWTGESEEDKETTMKSIRVQKPTYSTRSKNPKKDVKKRGGSSVQRNHATNKVEEEAEDEDDETLGGFIVSDEEAELDEDEPSGEEEEEEEEEEEDFEDDENEEE